MKVLTVFSKLYAIKHLNFIATKLKSHMLHKKTISSNYNQNTNKKLTKIGKKLPKSDQHKYNFMRQNYIEVERGVEYINYQREVAIFTDF